MLNFSGRFYGFFRKPELYSDDLKILQTKKSRTVKLIYSEKATKFCEISSVDLIITSVDICKNVVLHIDKIQIKMPPEKLNHPMRKFVVVWMDGRYWRWFCTMLLKNATLRPCNAMSLSCLLCAFTHIVNKVSEYQAIDRMLISWSFYISYTWQLPNKYLITP